MTDQPIVESGMTFGPYPSGHCFYIEKSETYRRVQQGVPMAEFLLLRLNDGKPATVWVVEAKSSSPRPEAKPKFDHFIEEIRKKLTNAFQLGLAACLHRHGPAGSELSEPFQKLDLSTTSFRFVLVMNGHPEAWLPPLQEELVRALHSVVKTWALPATAVAVINHDLARRHGLILGSAKESA